jgi:hypothetical protein
MIPWFLSVADSDADAYARPTSESILPGRVARVTCKSRVAEERRDEDDFALDPLRDHALDRGLGCQRSASETQAEC